MDLPNESIVKQFDLLGQFSTSASETQNQTKHTKQKAEKKSQKLAKPKQGYDNHCFVVNSFLGLLDSTINYRIIEQINLDNIISRLNQKLPSQNNNKNIKTQNPKIDLVKVNSILH